MTNQEFIELIHSSKMEMIWNRLAGLITSYFRTKVTGIRHIQRHGPMIIAPNHSGFCGFDVVVLSHVLSKASGRRAKILAHRAYFEVWQLLRMVSESFGLRQASIKNGIDVLKEREMLLIFPEAEGGNFKSSFQMYELQPFHTGFVRMALLSGAPIVPTLIVGAEESNFNLGNVDLSFIFKRLKLPIPVNLVPLPAKWHIKFLKPVSMKKYRKEDAQNQELIARIAQEIHDMMQVEILKMSNARKTIYV